MLQKIKCGLICSALVLLSTNLWASPSMGLPLDISKSTAYTLNAGEKRIITNYDPKEISAKCKISTQDKNCHSVDAVHIEDTPMFTINGKPLTGLTTLGLCHNDDLFLSADSTAAVSLTNNSKTSYIAVSCSITK
ncbi:hypothetical protein BN59_03246 [Legionella massiliensis]|uniref:Uncharacterized protein n=1 Tax=Legionella massiliensis TaxID=1034943 RepID=A0A078L188_9GAMM|nr:hypothetical protein [Legionella massiliensis]CDZ78931.1 hypothetical protein BN59_03246 [Legionella massiliensis]CEE14669.1 hypothetical protein BN1094_03246 [Legionella massiliensis]